MKKWLVLLLMLTLTVSLAACWNNDPAPSTGAPEGTSTEPVPTTEATEPTTVPPTEAVTGIFPEDSALAGLDFAGMTAEEGLQALRDALASYTMTIKVNGTNVTVAAADIGMAADEAAFGRFLEALGNGTEPSDPIVTFDRNALSKLLGEKLNVPAKNAGISYNSTKKQFVSVAGTNGTSYDVNAAIDAAAEALGQLLPGAEAKVSTTKVAPEITADSDKVKAAVNAANGYLKVNLTYSFTPEGGSTSTETISTATVAGFVSVSDSLEVSISKSAVQNCAAAMAERHSEGNKKGSFKATGGGTVGMQVTYYGKKVNQTALADDIYKCVTEGTSGNRTASYNKQSEMAYGGNYVEVNLTAQHLWVYKDGTCVVSTDLVSGCVAKEYFTPNGVYSIYAKKTNTYLVGEGYRSFVNYWMPFVGGYGLHDATWRGSFGGDIYIYNGSHGCVNLPLSAAKKVYNNIQVGTKVILYGGKTKAEPLQQQITGTTAYTVAENASPFKLDAKAKYTGATLKYASSDTSVVKVASDGTVTIVGPGTATITVSAAAFDHYTAAELKVQITVTASETKPTDPPTEPTDPPTEPTDPPTKPTDPPTEPTDPPTEPTDPPTEPTDPPTEPTDPPTEPTNPPTEPTDPPTEPTNPPTEPNPVEETEGE